MQLKYKDRITIIRGNHESKTISKIYGFYDECLSKYSKDIYNEITDLFNYLPLAAVIDG
jgi:hypothetical protein